MSTNKTLSTLCELRFRGDREDVLRSLGFIGAGLGVILMSLAVLGVMWAFEAVSGKGLVVVALGPVLGAVACLRGVIGLLVTTVRFRMYKSLLATLAVLGGIGLTARATVCEWRRGKAELERQAAEGERRKEAEQQRQQAEQQRQRAEQERRKAEQERRKAELVAACLQVPNLRGPGPTSPYVKGKLIVIGDEDTDYGGRTPPPPLFPVPGYQPPARVPPPSMAMSASRSRLDDLMPGLPPDLRAENLEEAQTVVWVKWIHRVVGEYQNPFSRHDYAYRCHATVTVIDRTIPAVVAVEELVGPEPPGVKPPDAWGKGEKPTAAVIDYLVRLPRR
jgi:hypothetical protein